MRDYIVGALACAGLIVACVALIAGAVFLKWWFWHSVFACK
jgi:hypothetical protein